MKRAGLAAPKLAPMDGELDCPDISPQAGPLSKHDDNFISDTFEVPSEVRALEATRSLPREVQEDEVVIGLIREFVVQRFRARSGGSVEERGAIEVDEGLRGSDTNIKQTPAFRALEQSFPRTRTTITKRSVLSGILGIRRIPSTQASLLDALVQSQLEKCPAESIKPSSREGIEALRVAKLPLDQQVAMISMALVREHLKHHDERQGATATLPPFDVAFPRTANDIQRRRVVGLLTGFTVEDVNGSPDSSVLRLLAARMVGRCADIPLMEPLSLEPTESMGDALTLSKMSSRAFSEYHDGSGVTVNGIMITSEARGSEVEKLSDLDIEHADVIGKGSGGRVLRATHLPTGTVFAVKEILLCGDDTKTQVESEISVLWGSSQRRTETSPFLVACKGVFYQDGVLSIVMELMSRSLKDALPLVGRFEESVLKAITFQVLHGLQYLHCHRKQLHRDIKPHNILYCADGWVKLSDFGIASSRLETLNQYKRDTFCGTLLYLSPWRAEGQPYSYDADIWSLGITLLELFTGKAPVVPTIFAVAALKDSPPRVSPGSGASPQLASFIERCLQRTAAETATTTELLQHPWLSKMCVEDSVEVIKRMAVCVMDVAGKNNAISTHGGVSDEAHYASALMGLDRDLQC